MMLHHRLQKSAERFSNRLALQCGSRTISFATLEAETNRFGRALREAGVAPGDRVAIISENSIDFMIAHWGILKAGGTIVPIAPDSSRDSVNFILDNCEASYAVVEASLLQGSMSVFSAIKSLRMIFVCGAATADWDSPRELTCVSDMTEASFAQSPEPLQSSSAETDTALVIYTSGSTGKPKGVMMSHSNLDIAVESMLQYLEFSDTDIELTALPMTHTFGLRRVQCYNLVGGRVILESNFRDPLHFLQLLELEGATTMPCTPAMLAMLLDAYAESFSRQARNLRYIMINSAPVQPPYVRKLLELLPSTEVYMYYGLTEAGRCSYIRYREDLRKIESVGRAAPNIDLRILDPTTMLQLPSNTPGEVVVSGPGIMQGYWNDHDASAAVLTGVGLRTGDLGYLDDGGFLYITGRIKDLINVDGLKVSPQEIEDTVRSISGIRDVAAIPKPHPLLGEVVKIFVVKEPGAPIDARGIIAACRGTLEAYKVPRDVSFCDEIPKTGSGKLRRFALRDAPTP
jgi:acyl-CoA synthetase (AMP-forming)/AMP-acid ligase II